MKKYFRLIIQGVGAMCLIAQFSCKKMLDLQPKSAFDEEFIFGSVGSARSAVMGVYFQLVGSSAYGSRLSMMYGYDADDMINTSGALAAPDNNVSDLCKYNYQSTNAQLASPFLQLFAGVERANICIKNIPAMSLYQNGTDAEKRELHRLHGEALTLRALFYLELIRNWGDLPAQFEPSIDIPDLFLPKTDRDSIYNRLIEDLSIASDLVPWKGEPGVALDERITKAAVKGMRARIALYRGGYSLRRSSRQMERTADFLSYYEIARKECLDIMQKSDIHQLRPSFKSVFNDVICSYIVDPLGEVILEVAMLKEFDSNLGYYDGPRFYIPGSTTVYGNSSVRGTPVYFYDFDPLDSRRDVTLAPYNNGPNYEKLGKNLVDISSGKFRADWINPRRTTSTQQTGLNWPILRLSDVLLMFAEAENELNGRPTPAAIEAFEKVRKRAFLGNESKIGVTPTSKEQFFNAVVNERYFEFGGEGIRKYDLIRWNLLWEKIKQTRDKYRKMLNREAPYANLPQRMSYKNNSSELEWSHSYYEPGVSTAPTGYTRINWIQSITVAWVEGVARWFEPNKSELKPIPQSAIEANPNLTQDYGY